MSFSVKFTGTPAQLREHIRSEAAALGGQSQKEFREVAGALESLVALNGSGDNMTLIAAGHGTYENEQRQTGTVTVELRHAHDDESHESAHDPNAPETETRGRETQANVPGSAPVTPKGRR